MNTRRLSEIIGKQIISAQTGEKLGRVKNAVLDEAAGYLAAFSVAEGGVLPLSHIQAVAEDELTVTDIDQILPLHSFPQIEQALDRLDSLKQKKVRTQSGNWIGRVADVVFNDKTGAIEGYWVSEGFLADLWRGQVLMPSTYTSRIEPTGILVEDSVKEKIK